MEFYSHTDIEEPKWNNIVWRYMGLDKFLDLLVNKRLFFTNAQRLTDQYEGTLPEGVLRKKRDELEKEGVNAVELEKLLTSFENDHRSIRESALLNCWSLGPEESYALWKIYLGGANSGVAIRTNVKRLKDSLEYGRDKYPEKVYIGKVKYEDYINDPNVSIFRIITTKRKFYAYENELRLFIIRDYDLEIEKKYPHNYSIGRFVKVNLDILMEAIYISPFAGSWFFDTVKSIVREINQSLLDRMKTSQIMDR